MLSKMHLEPFNIMRCRYNIALLFLFSVPDSPHEPDPEPYEPMPPRLIPLDEVIFLKTFYHASDLKQLIFFSSLCLSDDDGAS